MSITLEPVAIQLRRDTAANFTTANPVLAAGEIAFETDTQKAKIGDGATAWTSLAYTSLGAVPLSDIGADNGVAALNASGQVPLAQGGTGANLSATGGAAQFLKQLVSGGAVSVSTIGAADLPIANSSAVGGVKVGAGLTVGVDGTLAVASSSSSSSSSSMTSAPVATECVMGALAYALTQTYAAVAPSGQAALAIDAPGGWSKVTVVVQVLAGTIADFNMGGTDVTGSSVPDDIRIKLYNLTASADVAGSEQCVGNLHTLETGQVVIDMLINLGAASTLQVWAVNNTSARGSVPASMSRISVMALGTGSGIVTCAALPVITSFSPTYGESTAFTITGTGLTGATAVTINGVACTSVVAVSDTEVTAVSPATFTAGVVAVTTPSGTASLGTFEPSLPAVPTLENTYSNIGTWHAGASVTLSTGGANRLLVALVELIDNSVLPATISDTGGLIWTRLGDNNSSYNQRVRSVFWALAPTTLSGDVVTCSGGTGNDAGFSTLLFVAVLDGVNTGTPIDAFAWISNPATVTRADANEFVLAWAYSSPTIPGGFTAYETGNMNSTDTGYAYGGPGASSPGTWGPIDGQVNGVVTIVPG